MDYGLLEDGSPYFAVTDIESHKCSKEELGLAESTETKFMPIRDSYKLFLES